MKNYLLIWEVSDEIRYYSIPESEVSNQDLFRLNQANGIMVNEFGLNDEYAWKIHWYVSKAHGMFNDGKWVQYEIAASRLPKQSFIGVFKSGFIPPEEGK